MTHAVSHPWVRRLAAAVGIAPDLAARAGRPAGEVLSALRQAQLAKAAASRRAHLTQAQRHMAAIDPARHGTLIQHLQAQALALQGRGGDTALAHVTPGELVIPKRLQTPEVMAALRKATSSAANFKRYRVAAGEASVNPGTGAQEFFDQPLPPHDGPPDEMIITPESTPGAPAERYIVGTPATPGFAAVTDPPSEGLHRPHGVQSSAGNQLSREDLERLRGQVDEALKGVGLTGTSFGALAALAAALGVPLGAAALGTAGAITAAGIGGGLFMRKRIDDRLKELPSSAPGRGDGSGG
jgi:hypothetical protein